MPRVPAAHSASVVLPHRGGPPSRSSIRLASRTLPRPCSSWTRPRSTCSAWTASRRPPSSPRGGNREATRTTARRSLRRGRNVRHRALARHAVRIASVFAEVHRAAAPSFVVASIPHGGRQWPESAAEDLVVAPESVVSDWHTRELYSFLTDVGVDAVANRSSRFVADPNRDPTTGFGSINNHVVADGDVPWRGVGRR
jgi:hypothetical protein